MKRLAGALAALALCVQVGACASLSAAGRIDEVLDQAADSKKQGKLAEALAHYEAVLAADPQNVTALRGLVEMHHRLGRLPELSKRFTARLEKNPDDAFAHEALGLMYYALGAAEGPHARSELARAAQLAPDIADFQYRLGVLLVESDDYEAARPALARAVELDPKHARYRLPYATALARTGNRKAGISQLATVLTLAPSRDEVQIAEKTAKALVDPFRGFPQAAREQYELALSWLQSDSIAQAQQSLDALLDRFPSLAILHATNGLCALKTNDAGRAIAEFRRASELDPDLADPREYLGDLYFSRGRPDTAREEYEAALARNPYLAGARRHLAEVHLKEGRKDDAVSAYTAYLLVRPDDFDVHVVRATLLTELENPAAGEAWDDLVHRFPRRADVLIGAAKYYFVRAVKGETPEERAGSRDRCRASLEAAVMVDPENAVASEMLAQVTRLP